MKPLTHSSQTTALPKVSIGMPVYNGEKYIRKALDSLLAQTFTDFELIISDNDSTDKTRLICEEYCDLDKRIHYFSQPKNIGPYNNFLFVLNQASGKYFMWAAHDDYWDSNWIEVLVKNMTAKTITSFGQVVEVWPDEEINKRFALMNFSSVKFIRLVEFLWLDAQNKCMLIHGVFDRAYFYSKNGKIALSYCVPKAMFMELYFTYKLCLDGHIATSNLTSMYKRLGGESSPNYSDSKKHIPVSLSSVGLLKFTKIALSAINPAGLIKYHFLYITVPSNFYAKIMVLILLPFVVIKHYFSLFMYVTNRIKRYFFYRYEQ